jgi:hypothetical protein
MAKRFFLWFVERPEQLASRPNQGAVRSLCFLPEIPSSKDILSVAGILCFFRDSKKTIQEFFTAKALKGKG